jgi:hypothetical protein
MTPHYDPAIRAIERDIIRAQAHLLSPITITTLLEDHPLEVLGAGSYAAVFQHPTRKNVAIKISSTLDDGWLDYAKVALALSLPASLKIESVRIYDSVYLALIERLDPSVRRLDATPPVASLAELLEKFGVSCDDLHVENVMLRDSHPVVTDPCCAPRLDTDNLVLYPGRYLCAKNEHSALVKEGYNHAVQKSVRNPAARYRAALKKDGALRELCIDGCLS